MEMMQPQQTVVNIQMALKQTEQYGNIINDTVIDLDVVGFKID